MKDKFDNVNDNFTKTLSVRLQREIKRTLLELELCSNNDITTSRTHGSLSSL